eukprot:4540589-Lingulodinium_polyedra.AAC.1
MANDTLVRSEVTARDVQKRPIPILGEQLCPFVMEQGGGELALGAAQFLVSDTVREPLLSTGLLLDS